MVKGINDIYCINYGSMDWKKVFYDGKKRQKKRDKKNVINNNIHKNKKNKVNKQKWNKNVTKKTQNPEKISIQNKIKENKSKRK